MQTVFPKSRTAVTVMELLSRKSKGSGFGDRSLMNTELLKNVSTLVCEYTEKEAGGFLLYGFCDFTVCDK